MGPACWGLILHVGLRVRQTRLMQMWVSTKGQGSTQWGLSEVRRLLVDDEAFWDSRIWHPVKHFRRLDPLDTCNHVGLS